MKIKSIIHHLETWAHRSLQESYDNSGLIVGDGDDPCDSALITLDVTEEVIDEAIAHQHQLIIAHHPLIFRGIKKIGRQHWIDKCLRKAIKHDIAIYAIHTNLDNVSSGVNRKICDLLELSNPKVLVPKPATLSKLTVFVPDTHKDVLLSALFQAGAGAVGNYEECSFQVSGVGTFKGNELSDPAIGEKGVRESVAETRIEVLIRKHDQSRILHEMIRVHPYEEVAYYLSDLLNHNQEIGSGMIGTLNTPMEPMAFLQHLKSVMQVNCIKHTEVVSPTVERVAVCGGSGSFLLSHAIANQADVFITADFKYHEFFEANRSIMIADIGHYESEVFTKDLLHDELSKTFANFAFHLSKVDTNPIKYL